MFHLIPRLIPQWFHRAILPLAHRIRHHLRKWLKYPIAGASIIVVRSDGAVLLVRHSYGSGVWALPGGGLSRGEAPAECARRELYEEVAIAPEALTLIATIEEVISGAPHRAYLYACESEQNPVPDRREVIEARFFAADALPEAIGKATRRRLELWQASAA